MLNCIISNIEYYLPSRIVTNEDLNEFIDISPAYLEEKLGIKQRHFMGVDETTSLMGINAGKTLINKININKDDIDLLIVVTQSSDYMIPGNAPIIQHGLGLSQSVSAFDLNLACSGYPYALAIGASHIQSGLSNNCIIITTECYSRRMNMKDKTVCTLFGDAATATLLSKDESGSGFLSFDFGTNGEKYDKLILPAGGIKLPVSNETSKEEYVGPSITRSQNDLFMEGKEIFQFAVDTVPVSVEKCLSKADLKKEDIKYYIFHQANKYMLDALIRRMELDPMKVIIDLKNYGNTVSSTIPIVLSNLMCTSKIEKNDKILFCGFGVGLSWSTCIYNY